MIFEDGGNLVLYDRDGERSWSSNTNGTEATTLIMRNNGNLDLIDDDGQLFWSTETRARVETPSKYTPN